jgi:hypothetical protein
MIEFPCRGFQKDGPALSVSEMRKVCFDLERIIKADAKPRRSPSFISEASEWARAGRIG